MSAPPGDRSRTDREKPAAPALPSMQVLVARASHEDALQLLERAAERMQDLERQVDSVRTERDSLLKQREELAALWRRKLVDVEAELAIAQRDARTAFKLHWEARASAASALQRAEEAETRAAEAEDYAVRLKQAVVEEFVGLLGPNGRPEAEVPHLPRVETPRIAPTRTITHTPP